MKLLKTFALLLIFVSAPAMADKDQCKVISKGKAVAVAQKAIKGKALSAKLIKSRGPAVYRVKVLLDNGRVKTILVDGCKAKVLEVN
ncbi:PepSY domain-containing protein [Pleionea sediminis]|uniref:PepSY domain-containing protein n=1 Tax=Pleionea sediminis TaxID=2569479 RepID=UPI001186B45D|nr:PepSY domain-containing protein [Pleionea sediminis]